MNHETEVRRVSFRGNETYDANDLDPYLYTKAPSFFQRVQGLLPFFSPEPHLFSPVELQKDVVRLRNFYRRNGFLHPVIDYQVRLDTTRNTVRVRFQLDEGPPLLIQDVSFLWADSAAYAFYQFPEAERDRWVDFRDRVTTIRTGDRFTEFDLLRIQDLTLEFLKNWGYAFARITPRTDVDSVQNLVDIRFHIDAGPLGYISEIDVEGEESVSERVVRRELPFRVGDRFSNSRLVEGQREVFGLDLFRLAIADVPPQPEDSTVAVRIRVREAPKRYLNAATGFTSDLGPNVQGSWTYRNFMGGARTLVVSGNWSPGLGPTSQNVYRGQINGSVALRQPYLFQRKTSGTLETFYNRQRIFALGNRDVGEQEAGVRGTVLYQFFPFRQASLSYTLSAASPYGFDPDTSRSILPSLYSKSVLSLSGLFGRADDYINPTRGFLVRPLAEAAGPFGIQYFKLGTDVTAYFPVRGDVILAGRLNVGQLWPFGGSAEQDTTTVEGRTNFARFKTIRYYAGGASDVRGWYFQQLGPKRPVAIPGEGTNFIYEPLGGLSKLVANLEARMPFPGLGDAWRTAVFLDMGAVGESGTFDVGKMKYGVGAGVRYATGLGYVRADLAYKLNADDTDLVSAEEYYEYLNGEGGYTERWGRRFAFYLSIGQAF